ncbi:MAG: HD domain-containing protein, partial [Deltaproteobacteria bacterium]|nr:HD domain-containing protein [Deltaproteobacteria bacterium]
LLTAIAGHAAISIKRSYLFEDVKRSQKETEEAFFYTIQALARASEASDEDTGNHIIRVGSYARTIAERLGLPETFCKQIYYFAQMHDVGKIHIPTDILCKPGKLTEKEWAIVKGHCKTGAKIIGDSPNLQMAREIALTHHERWDGSGYPAGLKGNEIPLAGRITMLVDIYDALRCERAYKPAFDHEKSFAIITWGDSRIQPTHFDPQLLEAFKNVHKKFKEISEKFQI